MLSACNDPNGSDKEPYDPNVPVLFSEFLPDSGGIRTKFIIKGSNFGTDKEKVKVFFDQKEALVLSMNPNVIYALVPKLPGGMTSVKVLVEDREVVCEQKQFNYIVASSVSTIVGKAKESGNKDGTIGETTFTNPRYVAIDRDENMFVSDAGSSRLRLISLTKNKSITLFDKTLLGQLTFSDPTKKQLMAIGDGDQTLYMFDSDAGWVPEPYGKVAPAGAFIHSCAFTPDSLYLMSRINTGNLIAIPYNGKKGMKPEKTKVLGQLLEVSGGQNGHMVYNPVDNYFYCATHRDNVIWRFKVTKEMTPETTIIEKYISNGLGFEDGPIASAKFNTPKGISVDSEGNIYIADEGNNRIRKIDIKNGIVSTVAGNGNRGYKDGDPLEAEFNAPQGVFVDHNDFIYIGDQGNHCVRKLAIE